METASQNPEYQLEHLGITVSNLNRSIRWYHDNFGFQKVKEFDKPSLRLEGALMTLGSFSLEILRPYPAQQATPQPNQETSQKATLDDLLKKPGANHLALSVPDINRAYNQLEQNQVQFATGILDLRYFFCLDPDGTLLEIRQRAG